MTEQEKKSHYKDLRDVLNDIHDRKPYPWIWITYTCLTEGCGEQKVRNRGIPFMDISRNKRKYIITHCWKCRGQTKHNQEY